VRKILNRSEDLEPILVAFDLLSPLSYYFTPDDTLDVVMKAFGEINIDELPIVNSESKKQLIGTISRNDMIEAYNKEVLKRDMVTTVSSYISSLQKFKKVEMMDGQILCEIEVPGEFVNKTLQELDLRKRFSIEVVLIRQSYHPKKKEKQNLIAPKPDYRFKLGDTILIMCPKESLKNLGFIKGQAEL